jgi:hypothetical protein
MATSGMRLRVMSGSVDVIFSVFLFGNSQGRVDYPKEKHTHTHTPINFTIKNNTLNYQFTWLFLNNYHQLCIMVLKLSC